MGHWASVDAYKKDGSEICKSLSFKYVIPWWLSLAFSKGSKHCGYYWLEDEYVWLYWEIRASEAVKNLKTALSYCKTDTDSFLHLKEHIADLEETLQWFEKATKDNPDAIARLNYGEIAIYQMNYEEVLADNEPNANMKRLEGITKKARIDKDGSRANRAKAKKKQDESQ